MDRGFGVLGSALCLSPLVLGALAMMGAWLHWPSSQLALVVQISSLSLCVVGRLRMEFYDRWQARQTPIEHPMPEWPAKLWICVTILLVALGAASHVAPLDEAVLDSPRVTVASEALAWSQGGEDPLEAGRSLPLGSLLSSAAASLAIASGLHPLESSQLLALAALLAALLLVSESICRLEGNRGAVMAMAALLLGLNPLALAFLLSSGAEQLGPEHLTADFSPLLTTAISPFLNGSPLSLALAFTAMLLSATLSVLRRSSKHVPRLAMLAALGLTLTEPRATVLLMPGWLLGLYFAHLACKESHDNDPQLNTSIRRPGEPRILRSPFWRPALHIAAGTAAGLLLTGEPTFNWELSRIVVWGLVATVGPGCVLFMPGIRHLNRSPGREAYFFLGLVSITIMLGVSMQFAGDSGDLVVRLLALVLAVPAANGAMKVMAQHHTRGAVVLWLLVLITLPGPLVVLRAERDSTRPLRCHEHESVICSSLGTPLSTSLSVVHDRSLDNAVLILAEQPAPQNLHAIYLLSGRSLVTPPDENDDSERGRLVARLVGGDGTALPKLRGLPGIEGREIWSIHQGDSWPGFTTERSVGDLLIERAKLPDVILVTVSSLRVDRVDQTFMPRLTARAQRGLMFETAITPFPSTTPGLATLLSGLDPAEHNVRAADRRLAGDIHGLQRQLAERGYRSSAIVALEAGSGLLTGFEQVRAEPELDADQIVELALQQLSLADPRPVFLWVHISDLEMPYNVPDSMRNLATGEEIFPTDPDLSATHYGLVSNPPDESGLHEVELQTGVAQYDKLVKVVDRALGRLLSSVPDDDLLAVTAPHGTSLGEHTAYFMNGQDLFEPSIHVPLIVSGGGMPVSRSASLTSLADVPDLLLKGRLPDRQRVMLESDWRPGLGTGPSYPPHLDPTVRGAARRIWGERTATDVTLLTVEPIPGRPAEGIAFDLLTDPDEMHGVPADPYELRRIDSWRRKGLPASLDN